MNETRAIIERIRRINQHTMYVEIAVESRALQQLKPGESLLVRLLATDETREPYDPYLREQWFPAGLTGDQRILVERPYSDRYRPQQVLSVIGPVGHPYRFRKSLRNVLLVAYDAPPFALTSMISQLLHNNISVTLVLLGSARQYQTQHLSAEVEVIQGDDKLTWNDQVMTLGWADQIFVVAAQNEELVRFAEVVQRVRELRADVPANYLFGVFRPLLPCGVGACSACMLRVDGELVAACSKGPAFDLTKVKLPF